MSNPEHVLYVANTSLQNHVLMFALQHAGKVYEQTIPVGSQVQVLGKKFTQEELNYFIQKKEVYGMRHVRDISGEKEFIGLCYSIDSPININAIKGNFEHNNDVLNERREDRTQDSAVAIADLLGKVVEPAPTPLRRSSVELLEETRGEDIPRIASGVEYTAANVEPRNHGKRAARR